VIKVSRSTPDKLDDIQTQLGQIESTLLELEARLHQLESAWNGEARQAFSVAAARWRRQIDALGAIASEARRRAQGHVTAVGSFDSRRASAWRRG
jgi:uncharacterized protein YukE